MQRNSLNDRVIINTRDEGSDGRLSRLLAAAGARSFNLPLVSHESLANSEKLREQVLLSARFDWIIFTSARGVEAFAAARPEGFHNLSPQIGCVGRTTASAVRSRGGEVVLTATEGGSTALVKELERRGEIAKKLFLYPAAQNARPDLAEGLAHHGGAVNQVPAYSSEPTANGPTLPGVVAATGADAVIFCSPSAVAALGEAASWFLAHERGDMLLVSMGPSTSDALRAHGIHGALEPEQRSFEGIVELLRDHFW